MTQPTLTPYWADESNTSRDEPDEDITPGERTPGPNGDSKRAANVPTKSSTPRPGPPATSPTKGRTSPTRLTGGAERKTRPGAAGPQPSDKENVDPEATKPVTERGNGKTSGSAKMRAEVGCKMADSPERYTRMKADHWF